MRYAGRDDGCDCRPCRTGCQRATNHVYLEQNLHHGIGYNREKIAEFFDSARELRRDPYYPHVTLTAAGLEADLSDQGRGAMR